MENECVSCDEPNEHPEDHPGQCCDCFDYSLGMPLRQLNEERVEAGKPKASGKAPDKPEIFGPDRSPGVYFFSS